MTLFVFVLNPTKSSTTNSPLRDLLELVALRVEEVKVIVAVLFALVNKLAAVPRQESERMHRMHILFVRFRVEYALALARCYVVSYEFCFLLRAGHLNHIDWSSHQGAPGDVCKVTVSRVAGLQPNRLLRLGIVNTTVTL